MKGGKVSIQLKVNSHCKMTVNKKTCNYGVICLRHAIVKYCTNFTVRKYNSSHEIGRHCRNGSIWDFSESGTHRI